MTLRRAAASVIAGAVALSSCQGCTPATVFSAIAAGNAVYDRMREVTSETSAVIQAQCRDWTARRASVSARQVAGTLSPHAAALVPWIDASCSPDAPPPNDPIAGAVWLASLVARVEIAGE